MDRLYLEVSKFYGARKEIAEKAGVSPDTVYKVLTGVFQNEEVVAVAIQVVRDRVAKRQALASELQELIGALPA